MISIIIPVYNEEIAIKKILETLPHPCAQGQGLAYAEDLEVIVVDGGSSDRTVEFAKQYPIKLLQCIRKRAVQMNEGAKQSKGDILLFLHADCLIENSGLEEIVRVLNNGYIGGCLSQKIDSLRLIYRFIEKSGNIRARLFKIFYGDQAIFVRKDIFLGLSGFDNVDLFEDIIFSKKLKNEGKTIILNKKIYTSSRRWEVHGVIRATLINWLLTLGFWLGISPNTLKRMYRDIR